MLYFLKNQQKNIFQGLPQDYEERKMEQKQVCSDYIQWIAVTVCSENYIYWTAVAYVNIIM